MSATLQYCSIYNTAALLLTLDATASQDCADNQVLVCVCSLRTHLIKLLQHGLGVSSAVLSVCFEPSVCLISFAQPCLIGLCVRPRRCFAFCNCSERSSA
jgi:hypothetical protein